MVPSNHGTSSYLKGVWMPAVYYLFKCLQCVVMFNSVMIEALLGHALTGECYPARLESVTQPISARTVCSQFTTFKTFARGARGLSPITSPTAIKKQSGSPEGQQEDNHLRAQERVRTTSWTNGHTFLQRHEETQDGGLQHQGRQTSHTITMTCLVLTCSSTIVYVTYLSYIYF